MPHAEETSTILVIPESEGAFNPMTVKRIMALESSSSPEWMFLNERNPASKRSSPEKRAKQASSRESYYGFLLKTQRVSQKRLTTAALPQRT